MILDYFMFQQAEKQRLHMPYLRQELCILFQEPVGMASFRHVDVLVQADLEIYAEIGYGVDAVTTWNTDTSKL